MVNQRSDNTLRGARNLTFNKTIKDFIRKSDRVDFYKFTASNQIDFTFSLSGLKANANVKLLNRNGATLFASNRSGNQSEQILATLDAGAYYIKIQLKGKGKTQYRLRAAATTAEPGETTAAARNLNNFSGEYGTQDFVGTNDSIDYYRFTLSQISNFNANIDGLSATAFMRLYFDANNNGLIDNGESLATGYDGNNISRTMLSGTYFLAVSPYSGSDSTRYNLFLSATPDPSNLPSNPGSGTDTALELTNLSNTTLKDFVGAFNAVDYYRFTLPQISNFNANIDGLSATAFMRLYFDANNNGLIDNGESLATGYDGNNISRTMLSGTYFLAVSPYSGSDSTRYDLSLSVTPDPSNLSGDPGDRTTTAYNLGNFVGNQTLRDFAGAFDNVDYYKFSVGTTRNFNANIDGLSATAFMRLYFDANNNGLIDNGESLATGYDGNNISRAISAGNYFLTVSPYSGSDSTRYNLILGIG